MTKATKKKSTTKKTIKKTKKKNALVKVTSPVRPDIQFFVASDLADEEMIQGEILGAALQHYIYEFENGGKSVKGLSLSGTRETVRRINKSPSSGSKIRISPEPPIINRDVEYNGRKGIEILVYAEDLLSGGGNWGNAFEPYKKVGKGGRTYDNTFAERVALSKAQRNAIRGLIPEKLVTEMIHRLASENKGANVRRIEAPQETTQVVQPIKTNEQTLFSQAMKQINDLRGKKDKLEGALKKVDTLPLSDENKEKIKDEIHGALIDLQ